MPEVSSAAPVANEDVDDGGAGVLVLAADTAAATAAAADVRVVGRYRGGCVLSVGVIAGVVRSDRLPELTGDLIRCGNGG